MKVFVDKSGKVLAQGEEEAIFGGPWGKMQASGEAKWIDVPSGEDLQDCDVIDGALVVNAAKKAARTGLIQAREDRRNRLKNANVDSAGLPELRAIIKDILQEIS